VRAPTLLVVGERDAQVLELNRIALASLGTSEKQLVVVPGASHLFEEPGTLAQAARVAGDWFARFLGPKPRSL
jgi:pimeloyl-ACP methyl ester carboxylesterase